MDATGKCASSSPQGTLSPWADDSSLTFAAQNTLANNFAPIQTESAGITDCYPGLTSAVLIHAYFQVDAIVTEDVGIISFGGGYKMGNSGAPDADGGAFGVGISTDQKIDRMGT